MTARPFTSEDYAARRTRAVEAARSAEFLGVLVTPGPDLVYLTGYAPPVNERLTLLVLRADHEPHLVVPVLEHGDAAHAPGADGVSLVDWADGTSPYEIAAAVFDRPGLFAISDSAWALHLLGLQHAASSRFVSMTDALPMLRAVKDPAEIERLAAAGAAADATFRDIVEQPFAGRTEAEIGASLAELLRAYGHSQVDFTIVGSGPNGANPHHEPGARVVRDGDMVVLDFGGLKDGYGSDTTRTVHVGEPTDFEREIHDVVRAAQQAGVDAVRPGATCQDVDRAARAVITDAGYGEFFIHRTGHGIGLETHEPPYLVEGESQVLEPGMCFSVEPGVYLPDRFGVRIEDIVTVTSEGVRRLNNTSRELHVVA